MPSFRGIESLHQTRNKLYSIWCCEMTRFQDLHIRALATAFAVQRI